MMVEEQVWGKLTNTETNDEYRDGHKGGLMADVKRFRNTWNIRGDDTGVEGDDKTCDGNDHGDVPLVCFRPVLGVLRIPIHKFHQLIILPGLPIGGFVRLVHDGRDM